VVLHTGVAQESMSKTLHDEVPRINSSGTETYVNIVIATRLLMRYAKSRRRALCNVFARSDTL
jgi:hypothetical protein